MPSILVTDCHPYIVERWPRIEVRFALKMAPFGPWFLRRTRTLCTDAEQIALFAQGRKPLLDVNDLRAKAGLVPIPNSENQYTVTNADGVHDRSNHQGVWVKGKLLSRAVDIVPAVDPDGPAGPMKVRVDWKDVNKFRIFGEIAENEGLVWGGRWHKPDMPHVEVPKNIL